MKQIKALLHTPEQDCSSSKPLVLGCMWPGLRESNNMGGGSLSKEAK